MFSARSQKLLGQLSGCKLQTGTSKLEDDAERCRIFDWTKHNWTIQTKRCISFKIIYFPKYVFIQFAN